MRSIITACDWRSAASKSRSMAMPGPACAASSGSSSLGPQSSTRAPSRGSSSMLERATRLCRMSPTMVTVTPARVSAVDRRSARPQMRQDGAQVEQRLGGMLVHAVAGVEHRQAGSVLQQPGRAGGVVAQNDGFGAQRAQRQAGVFQRLALLDARAEAGDQRGVGAQALGGQLKAGAGARGGLVEEQRDAPLGQDAVADQRIFVFQGRGAGKKMAHAFHTQVHDRKQRTWIVRERRSGHWRRVKLAANGGCGWIHFSLRF